MKVRSMLVGAALLAAIAFTPGRASAQQGTQADPCNGATYSATLGLGGALTGCFSFTLNELGENAGYISRQFYWNGNFTGTTNAAPANAPNTAGTEFFNDDCGTAGGTGPAFFAFCTGAFAKVPVGPVFNATGELVLGLLVPDTFAPNVNGGTSYWNFSGAASRNAFPAPAGFQAVLMQLTQGGNPIPGEYLFAWEDINTGCTIETPPQPNFRQEDIGNATVLDDGNLHVCTSITAGGVQGDSDFNDSYIRLSIVGTPQSLTPEPMTMTLMATGLVGLAGAQIRRRKKN